MSGLMPQRPEQHIIDEHARQILRASLPLEWILHERAQDYGIDFDIEVFEGGQATGIHFNLQLKGKRAVKDKPSIPIKRSTLGYWKGHDTPTLLFLCDVSTGERWTQWAHQIDLYGSKAKPTSTNVNVKFSTGTLWREGDERQAASILEEVRAVRALHRADENLPIAVCFELANRLHTVESGSLAAAVRAALIGRSELVFPHRPNTVLSIIVTTSPTQVTVTLRGAPSTVLHYEESFERIGDPASQLTVAAGDVTIAIAFQLAQLGLRVLATNIIESAIGQSGFVKSDPKAIALTMNLLCANHRVDPLLRYLKLLGIGDDTPEATIALVRLMRERDLLTASERRAVAETLIARAKRLPAHSGSTLAYNTARFVAGDDFEFEEAGYTLAATLDSSYRSRGYWWRERGSRHFLEGRLIQAVAHYSKAVELSDAEATPLLADALLYLGRYAEARELFDKSVNNLSIDEPEWRLKLAALHFLIARFGIEWQERDSERAAAVGQAAGDPAKAAESALNFDLLCFPALIELALVEQKAGRRSIELFLSAAVSALHEPRLWVDTLLSAMADDAPGLGVDAALCARRFCEEGIKDLLYASESLRDALGPIHQLFDELPPREDAAFTIRSTSYGSQSYESVN